MKKYLVAITIQNNYVIYYFNDFVGPHGAAVFFYDYCKKMGIKTSPLLARHTWAREKGEGIIIDFEKIQETIIESIFELQ